MGCNMQSVACNVTDCLQGVASHRLKHSLVARRMSTVLRGPGMPNDAYVKFLPGCRA